MKLQKEYRSDTKTILLPNGAFFQYSAEILAVGASLNIK